jgi:hypothetical protein
MYYGKSDATTTASGDNTFEFFDHFEGTTLNAAKWTVTGLTPTISSSIMTQTDNTTWTELSSLTNIFSTNTAVRARVYTAHKGYSGGNAAYEYVRTVGSTGQTGALVLHGDDAYDGLFNKNGSSYTISALPSSWSTSTYNIYELRDTGSSSIHAVNSDSPVTITANYYSESRKVNFLCYKTASSVTPYVYVDWVLVRKYIASEPTPSFGTEQNNS